MKISDEWWTSPTDSENGKLIMVTGRRGVEPAIETGKYTDRIDITWKYEADQAGMPDKETSMLMEQVTDALQKTFRKEKSAIMTGIYTGDGERNYVFYSRNNTIFNKLLNQALADFELLPLTIYAEKDPDWEEYREMKEISFIEDGE